MSAIARFIVRRRWFVLAAWALVLGLALVAGADTREHIRQPSLTIPGSDAERADSLSSREFGGTVSMAVLLKGPAAEVEKRGPRLVRELQEIDGVQVLSPWAIGGSRVLKEPSGQALLALQVKKPFEQVSEETTPAVEAVLAREVKEPLRAEITGLAPLVRALNESSLDSLHRGELIALPVLFLMLLLIFRSPVAALVPALCGLLVTRVGIALMGPIADQVAIDALALNLVTMVGLALGVDYALLVVSRFREELENEPSVERAVELSIGRAGRTVLLAGAALSIGMLCALVIAPGSLLVSATIGVVVVTVVAVVVAVFAMPAVLAVLGTGINRWQLRSPGHRAGLGAAVRAHAAPPGRGDRIRAASACAARCTGAGAQHRAAERRQPAAGQRGAHELRVVRARSRRRLVDPVRGRLPHAGSGHDDQAAE